MATLLAKDTGSKFQSLESLAQAELQREALYLSTQIAESSVDAMRSAETIAVSQESGLFGQRALTVELLKGVLASDENITAAYVLYEPNADKKDALSLTTDPKEWMDASGRFVPYPFRDWANGNAIAVKPSIDYETSLYYDGVRKAFADSGTGKTLVTEPYLYEGQLIVEQSHPIVIDGRFVGIGATDRALASLERLVRERSKMIGAQAFLVSTRGRFVVATEDPEMRGDEGVVAETHLRTHAVRETAVAALVDPLLRGATAAGVVGAAQDPRNDTTLLYAAVRIETGGWTLVCTKPREVVVAPLRAEVWTSALVAFGFLGGAVGLVWWIALGAGRRVRGAALIADAIADGNLGVTIAVTKERDEVGLLMQSLQRMQTNLNALLLGVQSAGVTLDSSALELTATSREQESVAHRFGESSSQIAGATKQISTTGLELSKTMQEVHHAAEHSARLADGARGDLASVDGTIRELSDATGSIAAKLATISERASSINGVVTTIAKVADQTNLLSVNAAIEAEKAGERGRGFFVVAREIRRLADQTAGATVDIESMVREMQSAVGAGVMEMDRFAEKVRRGVEEVVESSRQMAEVIAQVESNAVRFRTVSEGMASQSQGAATISESMGTLATAAKRAIESAEEFGRTASELQRASQVLRTSVGAFTLSKGA